MVRIYSELLQRRFAGQLGQEGDEFINRIVEGAERLDALLTDLRTYTQVSATESEVPEETDAGETLKKVLANLDMAIRHSDASVTSTTLPRVRLHQFQLEQLFQNLIGNAIKYRGDDPPRVNVAAVRHETEWLFSVQDNGIGIEPEQRQKVFGSSNACTALQPTPAPVWVLRSASGLSSAQEGGSGWNPSPEMVRRFTLLSQRISCRNGHSEPVGTGMQRSPIPAVLNATREPG
jgi:hypothetical protein